MRKTSGLLNDTLNTLHDLQALKGLALLRSGKTSDSETLMEEIMGAKPADDPTLQAMTICYREMQKRKASITVIFISLVTY